MWICNSFLFEWAAFVAFDGDIDGHDDGIIAAQQKMEIEEKKKKN